MPSSCSYFYFPSRMTIAENNIILHRINEFTMPRHKPLTNSELKWYNDHVSYLSGKPPAGHDPSKFNMFNLVNRMAGGSSRSTPPTRTVGSNASRMNLSNTANSRSTKSNSSSKNRPIQKRHRTTSQNTAAIQVASRRMRRMNINATPTVSARTINTMARSNQSGMTNNRTVNCPRTNSTPPPDPYHLKWYFPHQQRAIQIAQRSAKSYTDLKQLQKHHNARSLRTHAKHAFRGGMIWHGTGSGKTSTILGIITKYMEAAEKQEMVPPYLCIVTTHANERQNDLDKYIENFTKLNYDLAVKMAQNKGMVVSHCETIRVAETLKKHISSYIKFFSYERFASCLKIYDKGNIKTYTDCKLMRVYMGKNWENRGIVIILDESHELIKANIKDTNEAVKNEYQAILRTKSMLLESVNNPFVHVYCASATPGTKISEYIETLNIVSPVDLPKFTEENIGRHFVKKTTNGKVTKPGIYQFADFEDLTNNRKFFAKKSVKTIKTPITAWHYLAVLMRLNKKLRDESTQVKKLKAGEKTTAESAQLVYRFYAREGYLATLRRLENRIESDDVKAIQGAEYKGKVISHTKLFEMIAAQYYTICSKIAEDHGIPNAVNIVFPDKKATLRVKNKKEKLQTVIVTPKLFTIAANIIKTPGKQFVYSHDDMTNRIIAKLLEKIQGWVDITKEVTNHRIKYPTAQNTGRSIIVPNGHKSHNGKRYIIASDTTNIDTYQAFMSGLNMQKDGTKWKPEPGTTAKYERNARGQVCRVIFVTGDLYTGVDINALRVVHLTNPFASKVSMRQAHGRATRASGHSFLPEADRNCKVLTYMTKVPKMNKSLDDFLIPFEKQEDKKKYISAFQWMIKKAMLQNSYRIGTKHRMQINMSPHLEPDLFPTADSIVDTQATFDEETKQLDHFEKLFSAKIKSQNRRN